MNIRIQKPEEWQAIATWLNAPHSVTESKTNRDILLENRVKGCSKKAFFALKRDREGQLILSLRKIGLPGRILRALFGKYSGYADTILFRLPPEERRQLIHLIQDTKANFEKLASDCLLPSQDKALLGFLQEKGNTPQGRLFLSTRMVYTYVYGEEKNVDKKPAFLTQATWKEILKQRKNPQVSQDHFSELNQMLNSENSIILFGENEALSSVCEEEFGDITRNIFFALKQIGKLESEEGDFRTYLTETLPPLIALRMDEQGGEEVIKKEYKERERSLLNSIALIKVERNDVIRNGKISEFVQWIDHAILPVKLSHEISTATREGAQLAILMRIVNYFAFEDGRNITVRPLDLSQKCWNEIVQLRGQYPAGTLDGQCLEELDQLMQSDRVVLCGEEATAKIAEKGLKKPLRKIFCTLKRIGQHSVNDHTDVLNHILAVAEKRSNGYSSAVVWEPFWQFLPHFLPEAIDPHLIDFILREEAEVEPFLSTRAVYLYVFDETLKNEKYKPPFLKEETWKEIQRLRQQYKVKPLQNPMNLKQLMESPEGIYLLKRNTAESQRIEESLLDAEIKEAFQMLQEAGSYESQPTENSLLSYTREAKRRGGEIKRKVSWQPLAIPAREYRRPIDNLSSEDVAFERYGSDNPFDIKFDLLDSAVPNADGEFFPRQGV